MRVADHLIKTLAEIGTKYIFSLSGNQVMPIYDAWLDSEIELIHVRHEGAAVHMADAWGRLTGEAGVALLPAGPGFVNSLSATYVAKMAESPVVVISGHAPLNTHGRGTFQEIDQVKMAEEVSKASFKVTDPRNIAYAIYKAFAIAQSGRPGPVHLAVPFDLLEQNIPTEQFTAPAETTPQQAIDESALTEISEQIMQAKRPLLLAGPALMRTAGFAKQQAALANIGIPLIGMGSPRGVFDPSLGAFSDVLAQTDLIVLLGKKLDFTLKLGEAPFITPDTQIVQIDHEADAFALTKQNSTHRQLHAPLLASPTEAIDRLLTKLTTRKKPNGWIEQVNTAVTFQPPAWKTISTNGGEPLHPVEVGRAIAKQLAESEECVFISDGGEFGQWMQALISSEKRVINGPSGSIGSALPFAIAASLACPNAQIIACTGDGAFGFHPFEFDTAVRYNIPFTLVIGNDACWNAEYQIQKRTYGQDRIGGVMLRNTPYETAVEALGGKGYKASTIEELTNGLQKSWGNKRPSCINVSIQKHAAPKITSLE